jgi:predicted O-linked N-acetylglucosamine transferase (SPINDLY family)
VEVRLGPLSRFGLPDDAHAYVCPQNLRKVHPDFDLLIAGILRADPRAVVAFVHDRHATAGELLERRWSRTLGGVARRAVVLPRQTPEAYLTLLASAHVLLDTLHFGGSNTLYDAVVARTPVVTLPGDLPRSRYAAALWRSIGIDDCIARSPAEYVELAIRIATDGGHRDRLRERIGNAAPAVFENAAAVHQLETFFAHAISAAAVA